MIFLKSLFTLVLSISAVSAIKTVDWLYVFGTGVIKSNLVPFIFEDEALGGSALIAHQIYENMSTIVGPQCIEPKETEIKALIASSIAYAQGAGAEGTFGDIKYQFSEDVYKTSQMLGTDRIYIMWEK